MASYFNLTLDTTPPASPWVNINNDDEKSSSNVVKLYFGINGEEGNTDDFLMKIWGIEGVETEADAQWETFAYTKTVTLPATDGVKTVYAKIRDDLWNETDVISDTITLYLTVPVVQELSVNKSRISLVEGKNITVANFIISENVDAVKVVLVENINDAYNAPTNVSIGTANGSYIDYAYGIATLSGDTLEGDGCSCDAENDINVYITGADLNAASPGDGVKIVKVFIRSAESGNWSV